MPGMIVAPQPSAVEEGVKVLARGGNAFDAALVAATVQFLVDPHSCGVGGYLVMTAHDAKSGKPSPVIDASAVAGALVRPEMWEGAVIGANPDGWGYFLKDKINDCGYQAICVPGMIRGMQAIHQRWCTLSWPDLFAPAIRMAEEGWMVGDVIARRWREPAAFYEGSSPLQKLHVTDEARRIYLKPDGSPYEMHETLKNPDYARTLRRIADHGPDEFYTGELAAEIIADLSTNDAFVTADDLADYRIHEQPPVVMTYRDYTLVTNAPPHGGPTLAAMLNILEGYDLASMEHNSPAYILRVSLAMKAAFADRNRHLADPRFVDVPLDWMLSKQRAEQWRTVIDRGEPIDVGRPHHDSPSTTQVSVVDQQGNCVSLTHSLGNSSGVISPGLGFMYNNSMVNFHPFAGHPNSIAAGKGRMTGMTPTIIYKNDRPVLVIGAPGATRIITSLLQVILNRLDFGMPIGEAVHLPRFDCQGERIKAQARIPEFVCAEVRKQHDIFRIPRSHGGLALVHAIAIDEQTGRLSGAADTGADGMALEV